MKTRPTGYLEDSFLLLYLTMDSQGGERLEHILVHIVVISRCECIPRIFKLNLGLNIKKRSGLFLH